MGHGFGGVGGDAGEIGSGAAIADSFDLLRGLMQRPGYAFSDGEVLGNLRLLYSMASVVEAAKLMFVAELRTRPEAVAGARPGRAVQTFLTEALRVSGPQANRDVAAAEALASSSAELPLMAQALADGEVHREHVDVAVSTMRRLPRVLKRALFDPEPELAAQPECERPSESGEEQAGPQESEPSPESAQGSESGAEPAVGAEGEPEEADAHVLLTGAELVDTILTGQARLLPPTTVDRLGRQIVRRLDPTRAERFDADAYERRTCSITSDFAGMGIYRLVVDPATHAQLRALLAKWSAPRPESEAVDECGAVVHVKDVRAPGQRRADALVDLMFAGGATPPVQRPAGPTTDASPAAPAGESAATEPDTTEPDTAEADTAEPVSAERPDDWSDDWSEEWVADWPADEAAGSASEGPVGEGAAFFVAPPVVTAEVTIIATLDQFAAAFGASDPAARAAGAARMSLAGTVGDFAGSDIHPEVLARLSCDSPIRRIVVDGNRVPLHHGRSRRLASAAQKRALAVRDGGCVVPGCPAPPEWTEAHHLVPWEHGGLTDVDAMVLLCARHHTAHHAGVYDIELRDGVAWVRVPAWQDVRRRWLANISATHGSLAERVARVMSSKPRLPWGTWGSGESGESDRTDGSSGSSAAA
jgi:hypothetical protein